MNTFHDLNERSDWRPVSVRGSRQLRACERSERYRWHRPQCRRRRLAVSPLIDEVRQPGREPKRRLREEAKQALVERGVSLTKFNLSLHELLDTTRIIAAGGDRSS